MPYIPERAEAQQLLNNMRFKQWNATEHWLGISTFEEHGIKISVVPVNEPVSSRTRPIHDFLHTTRPTSRRTRVGILDFSSILSRSELDFYQERNAHVKLDGISKFYESVDEGAQLVPDFLALTNTTYPQAEFLRTWLGGDITERNQEFGFGKEYSMYDYVVPFEAARAQLNSPATQNEMRRLEPYRDMYDLLLKYAHPNAAFTEPRLPEHEPPGTVFHWREILKHLQSDVPVGIETIQKPHFVPRTDIFPETIALRDRVPDMFNYLLEADFWTQHGIKNIGMEDISAIYSGFNSANYWIKTFPVSVVRFSSRDNTAAAEVLFAANEHGVRVPELKAVGTILPILDSDAPMPYAVMEGTTFGRSFIPAIELFDLKVEMNRPLYEKVAQDAGIELAKWHAMPTPHDYFGTIGNAGVRVHNSYYDIEPQPTWGDFLEQLALPRLEALAQHGVMDSLTETRVKQILASFNKLPPQTPGYVHGDFDDYNILFNSFDPKRARGTLIDPTPFSGSRYWDLAYLHHALDFAEKKSATQDDMEYQKRKIFFDTFIKGYETEFGDVTDPDVLNATKFVIAICTAEDFLKREDARFGIAIELVNKYAALLALKNTPEEPE